MSESVRSASAGRVVASRANSMDYILSQVPNTLGTWDANGRPSYLQNDLQISIASKLKNYITTHFRERGNNADSPYVSHDSDILIKERAQVWVNYFGGQTSAKSVFAYYCYRSGASTDKIKKAVKHACIIFPSAHSSALEEYSGVGAYLRYIDEEGKLHGVEEGFPQEVKIGVLL